MTDNVFVVMPAFNAGATIEEVFARVPEAARSRIRRYVVVNDGSRDDTEQALERLRRGHPNLVCLRHETNRGYGEAEKTLLSYAALEGAGAAILLHSDGQYSPEKIPEMLEPIDAGRADLVQGSRILGGGARKGGMPLYKYIANRFLTAIENRAFGLGLAEYHSGYMVYSKRALAEIPFQRLGGTFNFDQEMMIMARILGLKVAEVPIPTIYAGEISHLRPIRYGLTVLKMVWGYKTGKYHALLRMAPEAPPAPPAAPARAPEGPGAPDY